MSGFAHDAERFFAELLDYYGVAWEYEPVEFVLSWSDTGVPTCGFRPDFYLPDHDMFIELTTLRQDLVTEKNKKVRALAKLHPGVSVKLLYRKDVEELFEKYPWSCPVRLAG
ncbi:MAG: PDDEXK family nuclease [Acidimicrobiales bacterium]